LIPRGAITIVAIFLALFILMVSLMYVAVKELEAVQHRCGAPIGIPFITNIFYTVAVLLLLAFIISFLVLMIEARMFSHRF